MAGRPRKQIDQIQFEKLCTMQCTKEEIAAFFDCSEDTIERWCKRTYKENFAVVLKSKGVAGKISLRRNLFRMSEKNPGVLIFLCKNYLGMRDNPVEEKEKDSVQVVIDV